MALPGAARFLLQEGEGARARRKAWQEGGNSVVRELLTAQLRGASRAADPQLSAPQPLPRMIPAVLLLSLLLVEQAAALAEPQLCYILDAILFLYGIVLTLLYCRLKLQVRKAATASEV